LLLLLVPVGLMSRKNGLYLTVNFLTDLIIGKPLSKARFHEDLRRLFKSRSRACIGGENRGERDRCLSYVPSMGGVADGG
jgi:hypothetical protein